MKAQDFKNFITTIKDELRNKSLVIRTIKDDKDVVLRFNSLRDFGSAILKLEADGFNFGFWSVKNNLVTRSTKDENEFLQKLNKGFWNELTFFATDVKL